MFAAIGCGGVLLILVVLLAGVASAQLAIPGFTTTETGSTSVGFYFQAPADFEITGLRVPDESGQGKQSVAVVRQGAGASAVWLRGSSGSLEIAKAITVTAPPDEALTAIVNVSQYQNRRLDHPIPPRTSDGGF